MFTNTCVNVLCEFYGDKDGSEIFTRPFQILNM